MRWNGAVSNQDGRAVYTRCSCKLSTNGPNRAVPDNRKVVIFFSKYRETVRLQKKKRIEEQGGDSIEELTRKVHYTGDYRRNCSL